MEAGYDYLLMRSRLQQTFIRTSAVLLAITGAILLAAGIAYYVYAEMASSSLVDLNYAITVPQSAPDIIPAPLNLASAPFVEPEIAVPIVVARQEVGLATAELAPTEQESPVVSSAQIGVARDSDAAISSVQSPVVSQALFQISPSAIAAQQLYPGEAIKATYWGNPLEYEPDSYIESSLLRGYRPLDSSNVAAAGTLLPPTRIILPSIGVDSSVKGLAVLDLGDSRAYETPKHVVGHIPASSNPGELGSVWLFGHLESPIAGEGNVFYSLPKIPDLLRKGQEVYTIVENGQASYLYRITEAFVVHQSELRMDYGYLKTLRPEYAQLDPGGANIHLVVCVPRFVYDSRLIVSGKLVGKR